MAKIGGAKGFWNVIKSISVNEIAKEANRPISVAVVGPPEDRATVATTLYAIDPTHLLEDTDKPRALPETPFIQAFDSTSPDAGFPQQPGIFDVVIDVGGGRIDPPAGIAIYSLPELGGWETALDRILEDRPDLRLPLARNFPIFRRRVAQSVITETATANAQFALITGVTEAIPLTSWLLPVSGLSDIVVLTKNQTLMVLRLAAAYGLAVDYKSRMKEVAPILGNAFGWRAIARELVGAVPFVGFIIRASIAYAGTITVGKAAQFYYETGENVTASHARQLYLDAYETSKDKIRTLADNLRRGGGGGGRKRIAAPAGVDPRFVPEPAPLGLDAPPGDIETSDQLEG